MLKVNDKKKSDGILVSDNNYSFDEVILMRLHGEGTVIITNTITRRMHHPTWTRASVFDKNRHALTLLRDDPTLTRIRNTVAPTYRCTCTVTHCTFGYPFSALLLKHTTHTWCTIMYVKRSCYQYNRIKRVTRFFSIFY